MKYLLNSCLLLLLVSCHDMAKKEQLSVLSKELQKVMSIQQSFEDLKKDTISEIIYRMEETKKNVKNGIINDTIDLYLATKLDDYNAIYNEFRNIEAQDETIIFGSQKLRNSIEALILDINNGSGNRNEYLKFMEHEKTKVLSLSEVLRTVSLKQRQNLNLYFKINRHIEYLGDSLAEIKL